ncbi:MAG TPA: chorismate synthase [Acholeplasma sp.]|nr:chorismate synthase [Acholeplasma sp.]
MNTYGRLFSVSIYGESHQSAIGTVISGMKPGILYNEALLLADLDRRKPGAVGTTKRIEKDDPIITSGIYNGYTTGAPIHIMFTNTKTESKDYSNLLKQPRPGHADFVSLVKYQGFSDPRGGGHFSGRITAGLVAAGSFAKMLTGFNVSAKLIQAGDLEDLSKLDEYLEKIVAAGQSVGGIIEVTIKDLPIGLGEPFFDSVESKIAQMMFSIPAVKAIEFGVGFKGISLKGSEYNDLIIDKTGKTKTNNNGGINGGITNGNDVVFRVLVKPTSSVYVPQETYHFEHGKIETQLIEGRHDAFIARRAVVVVENACAVVLADLFLLSKTRD